MKSNFKSSSKTLLANSVFSVVTCLLFAYSMRFVPRLVQYFYLFIACAAQLSAIYNFVLWLQQRKENAG